ncbi:acetyl-CoA carboxylase biotin carboxylase subunit [Ruegeria sp. Ofav3-42]|uniref:acetyl/propionyl/methylcrotonyl-CoA carboxylase subunit alpha n=1 Tax=Ruegeria sp. Ofav3-42 TaxID=2917759 RepID=UPI001EF48E0B|nr:acetyl-CoA carboxylase biotin carboxylase subunit [Ruegeria sp. Ofav3-42]MCG7521825.1 acetyl-CoA carboxylase biotin carboxylase subunit [Ruegeria sp. Ofav3-42]
MAFNTLLVANRGEIAARILRTAQALGLRTVAVYTTADAGALHVALADEAVWIGEGPVGDSYLNGDRIIAAAQKTGAGAIHPGYGFLSENAEFAKKVEAAGLTFIGPDAQAIRLMGDKADAKRLMVGAGVPCVPGYEGDDQSETALTEAAAKIGFPIMVKAAAGGGGRGMRLVQDAGALLEAIAQARSEAENAFGSGALILEKAITEARHVELQVFADNRGNVIHLGERDCSVQRRHQKVIEEAPCPEMTSELRAKMGAVAIDAARAVNYRGAGTVEFLLEPSGAFYFLEMNTRLQVEHPVTEMITGLDLVALQIAVAQGEALPITQEDIAQNGHAIEVRLYAEDPSNGYLPATGPVDVWRPAASPGVRVDAGVQPGQEVSPFYDPMLAKIIAHGPTREIARARLIKAVNETVVLGTVTNSVFLTDVLGQDAFVRGDATITFLDQAYPEGFPAYQVTGRDVALALALMLDADQARAKASAGYVSSDQLGWSSAALLPSSATLTYGETEIQARALARPDGWTVWIEDDTFDITFSSNANGNVRACINNQTVDAVAHLTRDVAQIAVGAERLTFRRLRPGAQDEETAASGRIIAPMPGLLIEVAAEPGHNVAKGDRLAVLEAMKMQHQITATVNGVITAVHVKEGQQLISGDVMIEIEET